MDKVLRLEVSRYNDENILSIIFQERMRVIS